MASRLTATVGGRSIVFRFPTNDEAEAYLETAKTDPGTSLLRAIDLLAACRLEGDWEAAVEDSPLCVDVILPALFKAASLEARNQVKAAVRRWRMAESNLGKIAENLLAFKAYNGGAVDEKVFAGALQVAEWFDTTRGTFRLLNAFMKGLRRKR